MDVLNCWQRHAQHLCFLFGCPSCRGHVRGIWLRGDLSELQSICELCVRLSFWELIRLCVHSSHAGISTTQPGEMKPPLSLTPDLLSCAFLR